MQAEAATSSTPSSRPRRPSSPARARPSASPACGSATSATSSSRTATRSIKMDIDPEYKDLVHTDATALLRPKTGLKDMFIELEPGGDDAPVAKRGLHDPDPARRCRTSTRTRSSPRSTPTRATTCSCWSTAPAGASKGRGGDLRELLRALRADPPRPRARQRRGRRRAASNLRHLVSSLNMLNDELAKHDDDLARLVDSSSAVLRLVRLRGQATSPPPCTSCRARCRRRPTRSTTSTRSPSCSARRREKLRPAARALDPRQRGGHARSPRRRRRILRNEIRPFVREARPLVRDLRPAATRARRRRARTSRSAFARSTTSSTCSATTRAAARARTTRPARRATCSGSPGLHHTATAAVLDLRRQRRLPPGHVRGAVRDARADRPGRSRSSSSRSVLTPLLTDCKACNAALRRRQRGIQAADGKRRHRLMQTTPPPSRGSSSMVVFALSCFGLLLFLWLSFGGPIPLKPKGYRVQVALPGGDPARPRGRRPRGRRLGRQGRRKELDPHGNRTLATIELDRKFAPLRNDAQAILRQKTLLGETYVELTPGTPEQTIPEGGRLPQRRRSQPTVELDEIFDGRSTRRRARRSAPGSRSSAKGINGRGQDFNDALGNLPGFAARRRRRARGARPQQGAVHAARQEHRRDVRRADRERAAAAQPDHDSASAGLLRPPRRSNDALAETIRIFPTFLDESKATLARLQTFSTDTQPLVHDLRPVARDLKPTLHDVRAAVARPAQLLPQPRPADRRPSQDRPAGAARHPPRAQAAARAS